MTKVSNRHPAVYAEKTVYLPTTLNERMKMIVYLGAPAIPEDITPNANVARIMHQQAVQDVLSGKAVPFSAVVFNQLPHVRTSTVKQRITNSKPHKKNREKKLNKSVNQLAAVNVYSKKAEVTEPKNVKTIVKPSIKAEIVEMFTDVLKATRKVLRTALSKAALL